MPNERLILAIGQMERALTRLETVQARLGTINTSAAQDPGGDFGDLGKRHAALKAAAAEALAGIDALLAGQG